MMILIPGWGKSLLWFWQQALRCECPAVQLPLFCHTMEGKSKQRTQKASVSGLFTFWYWRKLLIIIFHFPELPIINVHGLKQSARQKISVIRVYKKLNMLKKHHPKCKNKYSTFPWLFQYHKPPSVPCGRDKRGCHCPPAVTCLPDLHFPAGCGSTERVRS